MEIKHNFNWTHTKNQYRGCFLCRLEFYPKLLYRLDFFVVVVQQQKSLTDIMLLSLWNSCPWWHSVAYETNSTTKIQSAQKAARKLIRGVTFDKTVSKISSVHPQTAICFHPLNMQIQFAKQIEFQKHNYRFSSWFCLSFNTLLRFSLAESTVWCLDFGTLFLNFTGFFGIYLNGRRLLFV